MTKPTARSSAGVTRNQQSAAASVASDAELGVVEKLLGFPNSVSDDRWSAVDNLVLVISGDGKISSVQSDPNDAAGGRELAGQSIDALWPDELVQWVLHNIKRTLRSRQVQTAEFENSAHDRHYEFIFVANGRDLVLVVVRDISARSSADSKMQHLAYVDSVTGLPNREFLLEELDNLMDVLGLKEGRAAVICFDVDQVDLHSRASGARKPDRIMKELGTRLSNGLRNANDPKPVDFERYSIAARIDFRQFGVVLPDINEGADAAAVTKRLVESLQKPIRINERDINVTACAGISLFPQDGSDAETLFANAMTAMDDARRHRPEQYKFHSGTLKMRALERKDLELELRSALDREEFDLNYLPIVDANTQEPITVEALLRWPTALFGSKSIRRVITLAEHTGLIVPIGDWVMRQSCKQLRDWHALGHTDLRLAINLSVQEFSRPNLIQRIRSILEDCAIDPASLDLEITEHMLFRDAMKGFDVCLALKGLGVGIILDDYGTGACSLAHLSRSPVDAVKIDNGFVAEAITSESERSACAAITAMAHQLGLRAIAEGVETEEQAQMLRDQGCDLLQGFLFCKPLPADELSEYLDRSESSPGPQE